MPLAIFNLDGIICKNQKNTILNWLEKEKLNGDLHTSDEDTFVVLDLIMTLWMVVTENSNCQTFRGLSAKLLSIYLKYTAVVANFKNSRKSRGNS